MTESVLFKTRLKLPDSRNRRIAWGRLLGASNAFAIADLARQVDRLVLCLARDPRHADQLEAEVAFFAGTDFPVLHFVDWETLPYDNFSPHQDIVSQRLETLAQLSSLHKGVVIVSTPTLLNRLPPTNYVALQSIRLKPGQQLARDDFIGSLAAAGYLRVPQVTEHGEYAVRGSLLDLFPMGSNVPIRIDFFDDEIESIRDFDPESQLSGGTLNDVRILPAREVPLDEGAVQEFRRRYRARFEGQPSRSRVYNDVSAGIAHGGIEYYLPLFFEDTAALSDYLPTDALLYAPADLDDILDGAAQEIVERFELCRLDPERPVLNPQEAFFAATGIVERLQDFLQIAYSGQSVPEDTTTQNLPVQMPPPMRVESRFDNAAGPLVAFIAEFDGRILFTTDSPGRRESLFEILQGRGVAVARLDSWEEFLAGGARIAVTVAALESGFLLPDSRVAVISEHQLFGERARQRSRRRRSDRDPETIIRQLNDLEAGSPVVHAEYGIGRYQGLVTLETSGIRGEFLFLEYAGGDKLYVPVHALNLISRYTGASPENAPLHKLGSDQWTKARKRAINKIRDVAAELLDIYARRAARSGHSFRWSDLEYQAFENGFPYEPTEDQQRTIEEVLQDLSSSEPMDRVVCGDVGFGKTEVALRATFAAVHGGKQVAILAPTTLLAQQHAQTFGDRFADWPVKIGVLSRFASRKQVEQIVAGMRSGAVDVVIGTHKLLQHIRDFRDVGLLIIDEEHRFGVRHKDAIKNLKSQIDVLTLTATPIPRTLNMALGGIRDMSLIATPPSERLAVKTFVSEWNDVVIREACLREIKRGGQVYFIHNRVEDIERVRQSLEKLVPEAEIRVGHGQMSEKELERVMNDFYHRRFNLLLCTTIVESGIDVPTANTIIINRADRFGLAQLHQLRGRVGRSHHRAYAYLVAPPRAAMTADAIKRLEAIDAMEDLGSGFTLATHDLEIRGAGELLGETQSGQIQEIGFSLYMELLGRAVTALKAGKDPMLDQPLDAGVDVNLHTAALLPDDYVPDVHLRLILYKRVASAATSDELRELQVELIDRFGLLPEPAKHLMRIAEIRLRAASLGIDKIDAADKGGFINFGKESSIDPLGLVRLVQEKGPGYRMQSAHRLQFRESLSELETRFACVDDLLDRLAGNDTAATGKSPGD